MGVSGVALVDLVGKRFGRFLVESLDENSGKVKYWHCVCDCGTRKRVFGGDLKRGNTKSCGCLMRESKSELFKTHGMARHPAYKSWQSMKNRCENTEYDGYALYGGRGITVCERWHTFECFWEDMGQTWASGLSIDREEVDGNYEPDNCRWATPKQQANNRRTNQIINTPAGPMNVTEASEQFGVDRRTIFARIRYGWPEERLLDSPRFSMRYHKPAA